MPGQPTPRYVDRRVPRPRPEALSYDAPTSDAFSFARIVGRSEALREAVATARTIAGARTRAVLLVGETGTGKELFARGIHYESADASGPFVAVNCAAIPETLLESELFGHEVGAFTGAAARKPGLIELAHGGTLFLDEVHQLPRHLQPKLLRVLEERRVRRVGGTEELAVTCRIIAAANVDIEAAVEAGDFGQDLFYRLSVFRIDMPPLRQRLEDIPVLANHFAAEIAREQDHAPKPITSRALALLMAHNWPGNVRELKNVIERATVLGGADPEIAERHLFLQRRTTRAATASVAEIEIPPEGKSLVEIEREAVQATLRLTGGNQTQAARILQISRPTLARIIRETPVIGLGVIRGNAG